MSNKVSTWRAMINNWKTTVLGILPTLGALAVALGFVDLEQQTAIIDGVEVLFDSTDSVLNEVSIVIGAVTGIGLLFSRDADKSSQDTGIR